jgi:hypothetical protein
MLGDASRKVAADFASPKITHDYMDCFPRWPLVTRRFFNATMIGHGSCTLPQPLAKGDFLHILVGRRKPCQPVPSRLI